MIKARNIKMLNWFLLISIISVVAFMFNTKSKVQDLNFEIRQISSQIEQEKNQYNLLKAELAYLNSPKRILSLAKQYLALEPMQPRQIVLLSGNMKNIENLKQNVKSKTSRKWNYKRTGNINIHTVSTSIRAR